MGHIETEKKHSVHVQNNSCSTPKKLDTSDNFHISPLQAGRESENEIDDDIKSSALIKKYWKCKLVDYISKEDDESSALDLSVTSTSSVPDKTDHMHCITE